MEERRYAYSYVTSSHFAPAINLHFFKLRMVPCQNACQQLSAHLLSTSPSCTLLEATDGLGNRLHYGSYECSHSDFRVESRGVVVCRRYCIPETSPSYFWCCPSPLASWDEPLRSWAQSQLEDCDASPYRRAERLMHSVHEWLGYERFTTDNATTASEVFRSRRGVCQDFAHLMIAACRSIGLKARYVNGLVEGEGETHAWVEVHDGESWYAFDPTHDRVVEWGYIKLAHGRDVGDCPSNRGRFYGWTREVMEVECLLKGI